MTSVRPLTTVIASRRRSNPEPAGTNTLPWIASPGFTGLAMTRMARFKRRGTGWDGKKTAIQR
jgi:hypothetical protein